MSWYTIQATAIVSVALDVEADSADDARKLFDDRIALDASLIDFPKDKQNVHDDGISQLTILHIEQCAE